MRKNRLNKTLQMITLFTGAYLIFSIQPTIAKQLLPSYGGAASVWITCLLAFQALLLSGYCYAHALRMLVETRYQGLVHSTMVLAAIFFTVFISPLFEIDQHNMSATLSLGLQLVVSVGLPFIALSATSPLIQYWYGLDNDQPYRLYALSNAGSLLALLSYPILVEPFIGLSNQISIWQYGICLYFCMSVVVGYSMLSIKADKTKEPRATITFADGGIWMILAATASFLLVATTNALTREVAPIPFLWLLPLSLYLLSFIFTFDRPDWYRRLPLLLGMAVGVLGYLYLLQSDENLSLPLQTAIYCLTLFFVCILCHGEIVLMRPNKGSLTTFYLYISSGGVIGTLLATIASPFILPDYFEFPIGLVFTILLIGYMFSRSYKQFRRPLLTAFSASALLLAVSFVNIEKRSFPKNVVENANFRSFYGVLKVLEIGTGTAAAHRRLYNDGINHGSQLIAKQYEAIPNTYFSERSGVGVTLNYYPAKQRRIGVIGLGAGTLAAYGRTGDNIDFFEINSDSLTAAENYFSYLKNSQAHINITMADGRLALQENFDAGIRYDILVIDAFSGDAIPSHLLTEEAWSLYWDLLKEDGALAIHLSNKYIDLVPVAEHHNQMRRVAGYQHELIQVQSEDDPSWDISSANWLIETNNPVLLKALREKGTNAQSNKSPIKWTDDKSSVITLFF
jgi:hypothetical protein